jgi:thermostable 8-oxoguanine DNA glycosylase
MHELSFCLTLIEIGLMSGYKGVRGLGDFIKHNEEEIINYFKPKK